MSVASGRWRGGLVLPLLLILVGVAILLGNVGAISWDRLDRLADLWPLLLVALGVRLVAGSLAPRAAPIVTLVVILAAGVAAIAYVAAGPSAGIGEDTREVSAPLGSASAGHLSVEGGAYRVALHAGPTGDRLYRATVTSAGGRPATVENATGSLRVAFPSDGGFLFGGRSRRALDITLSDRVPWTISLSGGAISVSGDAGGGQVAGVEVSGGASSVDLRLPRPHGTVLVTVGGGASRLTLRRPSGTEVRATVRGGASSVEVDGHRVASVSGDAGYTTSGWSAAGDRFDVTVEGGASTVTVTT